MEPTEANNPPKIARLLADKILVQPDTAAETTRSGRIILPKVAQAKHGQATQPPILGTVVAIGPGTHRDDGRELGVRMPMNVKVGDRVLYRTARKTSTPADEGDIIAEIDVLCVIEDEGEPGAIQAEIEHGVVL